MIKEIDVEKVRENANRTSAEKVYEAIDELVSRGDITEKQGTVVFREICFHAYWNF